MVSPLSQVWVSYGKAKVTHVKNVSQTGRASNKPVGFWMSPAAIDINDNPSSDFKIFCENAEFDKMLANMQTRSEFKVVESANILQILTVADADKFTAEFGAEELFSFGDKTRPTSVINWTKVAERYSGILVHEDVIFSKEYSYAWPWGWDATSLVAFTDKVVVPVESA